MDFNFTWLQLASSLHRLVSSMEEEGQRGSRETAGRWWAGDFIQFRDSSFIEKEEKERKERMDEGGS